MHVSILIKMLEKLNGLNGSPLGYLQIFDDGTLAYVIEKEPLEFIDNFDDFVNYYNQALNKKQDVQ